MQNIVFLHGYGANLKQLTAVKAYLTNFGTVYAPELPGLISAASLENNSYTDYVEWLRYYLESHQLSKVILIGNSFGAAIALHFVHKYPERIEKLILIEPPLPASYPQALYLKAYFSFNRFMTGLWMPKFLKEWAVRNATGATSKLTDDEYRKRIEAIWAFAKYEHDPKEQFEVGTTVLWGENDVLIHPYSQGKDWMMHGNAKFISYPGDVGTIYKNPEKVICYIYP